LDTSQQSISGIGIVISVPVNHQQGLILYSDKLPHLESLKLSNFLQEELGHPVVIENAVNAMALLEAHAGIGQGAESIFYVFVDNEINGTIIQNGKIWRGMHSNAGEIGYLVAGWMGAKAITLGHRASGHGIAAEYNMRSRKHRTPTLEEIIQYARQGDHLAIRVIRDGARIFGSVLSPVMNLLDPSIIVVGGRFAHSGELWWSNFQAAFNEAGSPHLGTTIVRSQYNEDAALQGAALISRLASKV
jgi:glucokinase